MAIIQLLLGQPQKGTRLDRTVGNKTASIFLDVTEDETFTAPSKVTQHPVENAVDISDHVVLSPMTLSIKGRISETPLSTEAQAAGVISTVAAQVGNQITNNTLGGLAGAISASKTLAGVLRPKSVTNGVLANDTTRLRDATAEFLNIRDSKIPITIVTGLRRYENYMLSNFVIGRNKETGGSINVSLDFTQFVVANSRTVTIQIPKIKAAVQPSNQGRKNADPVEGETGKKVSFALQGIRGVFGGPQ